MYPTELTKLYTAPRYLRRFTESRTIPTEPELLVLNDCILYTAYFVNGELHFDGGDGCIR
jgi:hypothetical protein